MIEYVWVALLFPLGAALVCGAGSLLSPQRAASVGCIAAAGSLAVAWSAFWELILLPESERAVKLVLWPWISCGDLTAPVGLLVDPLSSLMLLSTCAISFLVHLYSLEYMAGDEGCRRFIASLGLCTFFMLLLVLADNFLLLFVGWEGVGLAASLLIGVRCPHGEAVSEGGKVLVASRVADYAMVLALLLIAVTFQRFDFATILPAAAGTLKSGGIVATILTLLLASAACGKSAQLPFQTWLADAKGAPMPALALIYGATVAGAGAYLVLRCSPLFILAPLSLWILAGLGAASAVWAAAVGATQVDLRKVLAYLTMSQLGCVFLACGAEAFSAGLLQLMIQAFSVSLLVLGAGSVTHALGGETDMRTMGALRRGLPWTWVCVVVAACSLAGVAPFAGFLSKGLVLQVALQKGPLLYGSGAVASLFTAFCVFRMVCMVFSGQRPAGQPPATEVKESPRAMVLSLLALAALAGGAGWVAMPSSWGGGAWLQHFLAPVLPAGAGASPEEGLGLREEWAAAAAGLGTALLGCGAAYGLYVRSLKLPAMLMAKLTAIQRLLLNGCYLDSLYDTLFVQPIGHAAGRLRHDVDEAFMDRALHGFGGICLGLAEKARPLHDLSVPHWVLVMLGGIVLLVGYCLWQ